MNQPRPVSPSEAERWMLRALELAEQGRQTTRPNPMVGCVIVRDGESVGEGYHVRAGEAHAERNALMQAGAAARGADLIVTLEPCCHTGRTGPCTDAVINAGVARVFVGATDPNPLVSGEGVRRLRAAGIEVVEGILSTRCEKLNEVFNHWITTGTPWVTAKLATSLDGRIAAATGSSRWITGSEARREVHQMRANVDAILVGRGTALADDPLLTVRDAPLAGAPPLRVIVDSKLSLPMDAAVLQTTDQAPTYIATSSEDADRIAEIEDTGATVLRLPAGDGGVDLRALLKALGGLEPRPVTSLLMEGGGVLAGQMLAARLIQRLHLHMAPGVLGGDALPAFGPLGLEAPASMPRMAIERVEHLGDDVVISGCFSNTSDTDEGGA